MSMARTYPKRVLMTADTVGGVWTYAMELARALGAHGVEVGLATMGDKMNLVQKAEAGSLPNVRVFESCFKLEWMDEPRADVERAGNWLLDLERTFRPDIVHLNNFAHGALPWKRPKIVVGHSCVLSWWRAVHGMDAPDEWDEYRESVMAGLHGAELVIAPSEAMLQSLGDIYGPFRASRVIYNGRRVGPVTQRTKHHFVFSAGQLWDEGKNVNLLTDAAPAIEWPVMVAGRTEDPDGRVEPHPNVSYLGSLTPSEMWSSLERASIYALPARYEPFGLSALEAALANCALVLGDIPSLREIWGNAALYVSPDDPAALARTVNGLIENPEALSDRAVAAYGRAQRYTPERMADGYLQAYADVCEQKTAPQTAWSPGEAALERAPSLL